MLSEHRLAPARARVSAFLDSQRGLLSYYAAEGKADSATWTNVNAGDSRPQSPMLVPRAAAAKGDGLRTKACRATVDKSGQSLMVGSGQASSSISRPKSDPKQDNSPNVERSVPTKSVVPEQKSMGRDHSPDDESEHLQRLAQRRNRRRARRLAMRGTETDDDPEVGASEKDGRSRKRPKAHAVENKQRKKRAAPALLLMQNFSAQNLGKSRLTIKPSATVGVFNKGKASGKVTTKNNHNKRTGKSVTDIVFSESKFLNKTRSAHSDSGTLEDNSDYSDNHSDHSLLERANRRKDSKELLDKPSHVELVADRRNTCGSPTPSPQSIRADSPMWDIEQRTTLTQSPARSIAGSSDQRSPQTPPAQKDVTIEVERYAWASKLRHPELHTSTLRDGTRLESNSPKSRAHPPTTSSYFKADDTPTESRIPIASTSALDQSIAGSPIQGTNYQLVIPPKPVDPPSTPECLQLERPSFYSSLSTDCMRVPEAHLSRANLTSPLSYGFPRTIDRQEIETRDELYLGEPEDTGCTRDLSALRDARSDIHVHDWENTAFEYIPIQEECIYEAEPGLDYDIDGNDVGYSYDDMEDPAIFYPEDEAGGYGDFDGDTRIIEGPPKHDPIYYSAITQDEEPPLVQLQWADGDDHTLEQLSLFPSEPEFEEQFVEGETLEDEGAEKEPRLVQIITDESLRNDLAKSMNNHWRLAHRLY